MVWNGSRPGGDVESGWALAGALLDFLLPRVCVACERPIQDGAQDLVCGLCWQRLAWLPNPQCPRCGHPTEGRACRWCTTLPRFVRAARSVCWVPHHTGSAIVHALKYREWTAAASSMSARMARLHWPADVVAERAAVVPVPLSAVRERERGFNQAARLADALAGFWRLPVWSDVITRTRVTATQTRLTPAERSANVRHAFSVPDGARSRLRGCHLVLVDDVVTTGATLNACAEALFDAGVRIVSYATFGRARASGDR